MITAAHAWFASAGWMSRVVAIVLVVAVVQGLVRIARLLWLAGWALRGQRPRSGLLGVLDASREIEDLTHRLLGAVNEEEGEEDVAAMRGKFICVHCGQPCGVTGHVRAGTRQRPVCASTEPMLIVRDHKGREFGFCCPSGHSCMFGSAALVERRRRGDWRNDLMTPAQWDYLLALHYRGERPRTKGQARDIIQRILDDSFEGPPEATRAIRLREEAAGTDGGIDADFLSRVNPQPPGEQDHE